MQPTLEKAQEWYKQILGWAETQPTIVQRETRRKLAKTDVFFLLWYYLKRRDVIHPWVYQRCRMWQDEPDGCLDVWSRFHFKALPLDLPVPTPQGWKKHGDLRVGDRVFAPDGTATRVVAKTEVFHDADCYEITFCDGYSLKASGDHLWTVNVPSKARVSGNLREKWKTITINTRDLKKEIDLARKYKSHRFPIIPVANPVYRPSRDLDVDPYLLGAWLGDGSRGTSHISSGYEDAEEIVSLLRGTGATVSPRDDGRIVRLRIGSGVYGKKGSSDFTNGLRAIGVFRKKHIPIAYMDASEDQRWALLQGLMDTDGTCNKKHSQCVFVSAVEEFAEQVFDLCQSLGVKPTIFRRTGLYRGERRAFWQVQFRGRRERSPFRLTRKAAACAPSAKHRRNERRIMSIEPVASVPVSCIQVQRRDGLYLVGRNYITTHNSTIITFAGTIQGILSNPEDTYCIFSNTSPLARQFLRQIKTEFEDNGRLKVDFDDVLWSDPEKMASKWSEHEGIIVKRQGNPKEATVEAFGLIDNQPTSKHFSHRIYDDVVTQESVGSIETIRKTTERWELSIATGQGGGKDIERYVGTFYHGNDTYQEIMRRGVVKVRRYPATVDGKADGDPVLMDQEALMKLGRKMGPATFSMQMLLDVKGGSIRAFTRESLRWWEPNRKGLNVYIIVDPASGKKRWKGGKNQNDYTSMWVIGIDGNENRMVIDAIRDRLNLDGRTKALMDLHRKYKPIQQVGYEESGMQADIEHIEYVQKQEAYRFDITPLTPTLAKQDVIESIVPQLALGQWYLPEGGIRRINCEGQTEDVINTFLVEEFDLYPVAKHDDSLNGLGLSNHKDIRIVVPGMDYTKVAAARERNKARRQRSVMGL